MPEVLKDYVAPIAVAITVLGIGWMVRAIFAIQKLITHEARPNGGESAKDYMRKTYLAVEANKTEITQANERVQKSVDSVKQSIDTNNHLLMDIRDAMQEHNRITATQTTGLIGALIERVHS